MTKFHLSSLIFSGGLFPKKDKLKPLCKYCKKPLNSKHTTICSTCLNTPALRGALRRVL